MDSTKLAQLFNRETLLELFPPQRTGDFFEALFGDAEDGAYDIKLNYHGYDKDAASLRFHLELHQRPGCCLACNMTYGLPEVFSRHPVINIKGLVQEVERKLAGSAACKSWRLGHTIPRGSGMHIIPLEISLV